jgi:hypothetical protein
MVSANSEHVDYIYRIVQERMRILCHLIFFTLRLVPKVHTHMPALSFAFAGGKSVSIVALLKRNEKI